MTIQVEFMQLVGLLVSFITFCGVGGGVLLRLVTGRLDDRFASQEKARADAQQQLAMRLDAFEQVNRDETIQWQRVEREFLKFQADLPMRYVMRDDYIRGQTVLEAKIDAVMAKVDSANLRAALNGDRS